MLPLQTVVALGLYLSGAPLQHSSSSAASRAAVVRAQSSSAPVVGLDVVELTKDFLKSASGYYSPVDASKLDEAFVFRAPTLGPRRMRWSLPARAMPSCAPSCTCSS